MVSSQHIKRGLGSPNFPIAFATSLIVSPWASSMISVPLGPHPSHGNREMEQKGQVHGRRRTLADVSLSNLCGSSGEMTPLTEAKMRSWWFSAPGAETVPTASLPVPSGTESCALDGCRDLPVCTISVLSVLCVCLCVISIYSTSERCRVPQRAM